MENKFPSLILAEHGKVSYLTVDLAPVNDGLISVTDLDKFPIRI